MKLYEYIDKAIYNYASCYDSPDTSDNEEFSDALVDVIDLIRESSIGELELKEEDDYDDERDYDEDGEQVRNIHQFVEDQNRFLQ